MHVAGYLVNVSFTIKDHTIRLAKSTQGGSSGQNTLLSMLRFNQSETKMEIHPFEKWLHNQNVISCTLQNLSIWIYICKKLLSG